MENLETKTNEKLCKEHARQKELELLDSIEEDLVQSYIHLQKAEAILEAATYLIEIQEKYLIKIQKE